MFNDYNWTCCRLCEAVVHKALQEHLDSLHVAFSLNLCLNLYWRLTAEPDSHQSVRHILQPPSIQVQHVGLSAAQQRNTLSIISRRVSERSPSPAPSLHLLLLPGSAETHEAWCEGSARWRTGTLQHNNFCIFMHALHDSERVWMDYFEAVVTRRGTTGARTSLPSYLCSLVGQTRLEWSENRREVSWLGLGVSGQTTLQSLSIITALMVSVHVLGSHWLSVWHSQYYACTNMNNSCDKYSLSFKMEIQLLITTCGVSIKYFWVFIPEQTCAASRRKRN